MAFNSVDYAVFFALVFGAFWSLRAHHRTRTLMLVLASAWFYTRFDYGADHPRLGWVYLAVLTVSAMVDFAVANAIHAVDVSARATADPVGAARRRKQLLILSIVYNLGVLAWFKYTGFAVETARALLGGLGVVLPGRALKIVLPIGISFFTFETMSYTIDVYRRELRPAKSFLEYLLFISFFPHLVAGPIIRPRDMLPQLRGDPGGVLDPLPAPALGSQTDRARTDLDGDVLSTWNPLRLEDRGSRGVFLIGAGLLKKVVIADYLALNLVDRVFDRPEWFSAPEAIAAVYGYALQIYCDFSGYTDIAIGSALLLGYVLPKNFDAPYTATSLQDFWRRWHISLSSWLRDYLYVPLGGSRGPAWKTYRNLMLTMVLGGLWHGASWNFVVWGAMHGVALAATRMWQRRERPTGAEPTGAPSRTKAVLQAVLTFHYVCLAWIFFRAEGFGRAASMIRQIALGAWHVANLPRGVVAVLVLGFATHLIPARVFGRIRGAFVALPAPAQGAVAFVIALVLREVATSQVVPFVYFQF